MKQMRTTFVFGPYGGVYPQELTALQHDYAALWNPLSDLIMQLADIVKM